MRVAEVNQTYSFFDGKEIFSKKKTTFKEFLKKYEDFNHLYFNFCGFIKSSKGV